MKKKDKRKNNGGAREGAGKKKIYENPATIQFLAERRDIDKAKGIYGRGLNRKFNTWLKRIILIGCTIGLLTGCASLKEDYCYKYKQPFPRGKMKH